MRSTLLWTVAVLGLLLVGCKNEQRLAPTGETFDLNYITPDFAGAVIAHPSKFLQSDAIASLTDDESLKKAEQELGIDPRKIDEVMLLFGPPQNGDPTATAAAVITLTEPIDHEGIIKKLELKVEKLAHEGKEYFKAHKNGSKEPAYFFYPNDRTVVISTEPTLKKILTAKGTTPSPLAQQIKKTPLDHDVILVGVMEPVRDLYEKAIQTKQPKGAVGEFAKLPKDLKAATFTFDVSTNQPARLILEGNDEEAAKEIATQVQAAHGLALAGLAEKRDQIEQQVPFGKGQAVSNALDKAIKSVNIDTQGNVVTVKIDVNESINDLAKEFKPIVDQMTGQHPGQ